MKFLIAASCILTVCHGALITIVPAVSHYHTQDSLGQYSYGYSGGPSAKQELRTVDGITQGGYSYIDANNVVQTVSYVSDPVNGFRVAATNIPLQAPHIVTPLVAPLVPVTSIETVPAEPRTEEVAKAAETITLEEKSEIIPPTVPEETPEVKAARLAHLKAYEEAKVAAEHSRKRRSAAIAPVLFYSPVISSQYQVQDNLGQYSYGYNDGLSAKAESRSFNGVTSGGYSYIDANGQVQNVNYIADALGFRVAASNLPEGPKAVEVPAAEAPVAPSETPEVIAAKTAHLKAHEEAKERLNVN